MAYKWILVRIILNIGLSMMVKNLIIIIIIPVNTIGVNVFKVLIISWVDSSGAILNHTEKEHITRTVLMLTMDGDDMIISSFSPLKSILVDGFKEKVVEKPNIYIRIVIKSTVQFQILKEKLSLSTKPTGQVTPEPFNAYIMDTSGL